MVLLKAPIFSNLAAFAQLANTLLISQNIIRPRSEEYLSVNRSTFLNTSSVSIIAIFIKAFSLTPYFDNNNPYKKPWLQQGFASYSYHEV
jgi:hypothetical protein